MDYEKKEKLKKVGITTWLVITTIFSIFMIVVLIVAGATSKSKTQKANAYYENYVSVSYNVKSKAQPKYVSYDDEQYAITLNTDELNNYTWLKLFHV